MGAAAPSGGLVLRFEADGLAPRQVKPDPAACFDPDGKAARFTVVQTDGSTVLTDNFRHADAVAGGVDPVLSDGREGVRGVGLDVERGVAAVDQEGALHAGQHDPMVRG